MSLRALPLLVVAVHMGCASTRPAEPTHRAAAHEPSRASPWVLVTVRSASIKPAPSGEPWDQAPKEDPNPLGAVAKLAGFFDPTVGAVAAAVGALAEPKRDPEKSLPDPFFTLTLNEDLTARTIQSTTQTDTLNPAWNYSAYVDLRTLRAAGLDLEVYDAEGDAPKEHLGALNIPRAELERAAAQSRPRDIHHVQGHLLALEVRIEMAPQGQRGPEEFALPLKRGVVHPDNTVVPAGTIITVRVEGKGAVSDGGAFGLGCPGTSIGPEGLTSGQCREYNIPAPPALASAAHGSAFVAVGSGDEMTAVSIGAEASCAQFAAESAGPLLFGVNDNDPSNNRGTFTFTYTLASPATPPEPCPSEAMAAASGLVR